MLPTFSFLYVYRRFRSNATGEKVTYTNWASNQPDNNGASGEDCVIENNDGTWSDVDCRWDHPYITSAHFWTFSDPPTHYVSINTALKISKNSHFLDPSSPWGFSVTSFDYTGA